MSRWSAYFWGLWAISAPWWTPRTARRFADARLRALVRHCWDEVPVYRRLWEAANVDPSAVGGLDDLAKLPFMHRALVRDGGEAQVVAESRRRGTLTIRRTSGSSGAPLTIRRSGFEEWLLRGLRMQAEILQGDFPWRTRFRLATPRSQRDFRRIRPRPVYDANCLDPMPSIIQKLLAFQPEVVGGYSGSVASLAAALPKKDRERLHVKGVYCVAETMTSAMRKTIRDAFGVTPLTLYASHEFNLIAAECPQTGWMHVMHGCVIVEVLRDGVPVAEGEQGEAVITALHSYAMPFVRYRLADLVIRGPAQCPCGAPYPVIGEVQGRVMDPFPLPDGGALHPYSLVRPVLAFPEVLHYQIVQEQLDRIRVRLVGPDLEQACMIEDRLQEICGPSVRLAVEVADAIRPEANGKYRPCYSLVQR